MSHIADVVSGGIEPAQHTSFEADSYPLELRFARYAARVTRIGPDSRGNVRISVEDPEDGDTYGDVTSYNLWPVAVGPDAKNSSRPMPSWRHSWLARVSNDAKNNPNPQPANP